jgi:F-type H+-transporting ATPase subunit epsilon
MQLNILSPEKRIATAIEVNSITLPGSEGQIQILPEHANMIGTVETGQFAYSPTSGNPVVGVMSSGFFEVHDGTVTVAAETCELATEIDANRAKVAQSKAEGALKDPELDPKLFRKYELKLQRALIRQHVAGKEFSSLEQ